MTRTHFDTPAFLLLSLLPSVQAFPACDEQRPTILATELQRRGPFRNLNHSFPIAVSVEDVDFTIGDIEIAFAVNS